MAVSDTAPRLAGVAVALLLALVAPPDAQTATDATASRPTRAYAATDAGQLLTHERQLRQLHAAGAPDLLETDLEADLRPTATTSSSTDVDDPEAATTALLRVVAETGGAFVTGIGGAVVGGLGGLLIGAHIGYTRGEGVGVLLWPVAAGGIGALIGGYAAMPLGVWLAGKLAGGHGNLSWTYVGFVAAMGLAYGLAGLVPASSSNVSYPLSALSLVGSLVAFELSHHAAGRDDTGESGPDEADDSPDGELVFLPHVSVEPPASSRHGGFRVSAGVGLRF